MYRVSLVWKKSAFFSITLFFFSLLGFPLDPALGESIAYIMPQTGDRTIYRISVGEEPGIDPWCEAPPFNSSVASLTVTPDEDTVHIYHPGHLLVWNREDNKYNLFPSQAQGHFGMHARMSSSGRYQLAEFFGSDRAGRRFALFLSGKGEPIQYVMCPQHVTTGVCFAPDEGHVYATCQFSIVRTAVAKATEVNTWLEEPPAGGIFADIRPAQRGYFITTAVRDKTGEQHFIIESTSFEGRQRKKMLASAAGTPFDYLPPMTPVQAFYHPESGALTFYSLSTGESWHLLARRDAVLAALDSDSDVYEAVHESISISSSSTFVIFDYTGVSPDGHYAVLGIGVRSMRKRSILIFYDLRARAWHGGVVVGTNSAGGATYPFFLRH